MAVSKAQMKATEKWQKENYFKALIRFPKDAEDLIRKAAGDSLNGYIVNLVLQDIGYKKNDN